MADIDHAIVRAKQAAAEQGLDGIKLTDQLAVTYLTSFHAGLFTHKAVVIILPDEEKAILIVNTLRKTTADLANKGGRLIIYNYQKWQDRPMLAQTWDEAVFKAMQMHFRTEGLKIGTDMQEKDKNALQSRFNNIEFSDFSETLQTLRQLKSKEERRNQRIATSITNAAMTAIKPRVVPGCNEYDLWQIGMNGAMTALRPMCKDVSPFGFSHAEGGNFFDCQINILANGRRLANILPPNTDPIEKGMITVIIVCKANYMAAELERSISVGNAPSHELRAIERVHAYRVEMAKRIKPGVRKCDVYFHIAGMMAYDGYKPPHSLGHDIGLGHHEHQRITATNTSVFRIGECFTAEPNVRKDTIDEVEAREAEAGFKTQISDTWEVTKNGVRFSNRFADDATDMLLEDMDNDTE